MDGEQILTTASYYFLLYGAASWGPPAGAAGAGSQTLPGLLGMLHTDGAE